MFEHWIIGTIAAAVLGVVIGCYFSHFLQRSKAILSLLIAVCGAILLAYWDGDQFSHIPGEEAGDVLIYLLMFYGFIVVMSSSLGERLRRWVSPKDPGPGLDPVDEMMVDIETATDRGAAADMPWTVKRWKPMSVEQKQAWITSHIDAIFRYLKKNGGWRGVTDEDFVAELERLDRYKGRQDASSRLRRMSET